MSRIIPIDTANRALSAGSTPVPSLELPHPAALIGLDWGTSSLRSYLFDAQGQVQATKALPWGIMRLPKVDIKADAPERAWQQHHLPFELAFDLACGAWLSEQPDLPVLACGMVGSAQGWMEVPYVEGAADAAILAQAIGILNLRGTRRLHIIPGVFERGVLPNVMRGEETQIIGISLSRTNCANRSGRTSSGVQEASPTLIGLPGTHAKWAWTDGGRISHFDTFMTGEVFAILRDHSLLGRTMAPSEGGVTEAFLYGVTIARSQETSLLATLFSVRTLGLTGQLKAEQQSDYLSGLLIGNELVSLEKCLARQDGLNLLDRTIVLCGEAGLCERYRAALASLGCHTVDWVSDATERGLWHIAVHAGLVSMPTRFELPLSPTAQPSIGTMKEEAQ